jgi:lysophospholipase
MEVGFDPDSLRQALKPLVPGSPTVLTPQEDAYLRHYGIHFVEEYPDLAHHFGAVKTDSHSVAAHLWSPRDARGTAVVVHGYYDHTGLYGHLIRHLIDRGLAVLSFDLPGHGLSSGAPATIETFDHYVAAFDACIAALGAHLPKPWHLLGQSTGGAVAMEWLLANGVARATSPFSGIVLLAPLVRPYLWPVSRLFYEVVRRFITERERTFSVNAENPEFIEFLKHHDPLQARVLPVQWVTAMVAWKKRFVSRAPSDLGLLVVQGTADRTVDHRYNLKIIEQLFDAKVVYVPEARHHLVNESVVLRQQIFQAVDAQLDTVG